MKLLTVETSSSRGSLCLSEIKNNDFVKQSFLFWDKENSHSEVISENFKKILDQLQWSANELTHIAVGVGPGSFTGIRVGLNFAKSLAYALDLPILGMNSLRILAHGTQSEQLPILSAVNAYKNQVFVSVYQGGIEKLSPSVMGLEDLKIFVKTPYLGRGDAFEIYVDQLGGKFHDLVKPPVDAADKMPCAARLSEIILQDQSLASFTDWKSVNALYIRSSSAEEKLKGGALKPMPRF